MMGDLQLFLARFNLETTRYMSDGSEKENDLFLIIWAEDYDDAERKLLAQYPNDEYATYYSVGIVSITPAII
jgi:hypothetical protein